YRAVDGTAHQVELAAAHAAQLGAALPWRAFRWHRGQQHYSGTYWSATTASHVVYESRLELSRLILADFDPTTVGIVAQPFLIEHDGRRHIPDFLLVDVDGMVTVVNVKPAERLQERKVKEALRWAGDLFLSRGWRSEIWSGTDPVAMSNVRFLAGYRRKALFDSALVATLADVIQDGDRIGDVEERLRPHRPSESRPVILHLLWMGALRADLSAPLDRETVVARSA
ncbi:MAG: hypothetical protein QOE93_1275, partial [Actinomycetota bacterium]|nr:hypothetical protein [Actinomycetota bacterium]